MPRPQFRLRSLFIITAIMAVGCLVVEFCLVAVPYWHEQLRPLTAGERRDVLDLGMDLGMHFDDTQPYAPLMISAIYAVILFAGVLFVAWLVRRLRRN